MSSRGSWDKGAGAARSLARTLLRRDRRLKRKVAFCSPLPPARTGIASYGAAVLAGLRRAGFFDRHRVDVMWPVRPRQERLLPWYGLGIYQLGNNVEFHRSIYRSACAAPGLVVLHDLALDDFVRGMKATGEPLGFLAEREAVRLRDRLTSADAVGNEPLREPWCAHVVRRSRGVIVHSEFGRRYLAEFGSRTPVFVVPHPVVERERDLAAAARRRAELRGPLEARGARVVVGAFGDLNEAKMLDLVSAAVERLDPSVHLVVVGRRIPGYDAEAAVTGSGLGSRLTFSPDVTDDDFRAWLAAADVAVDLRFPHRGEVSGSLARAMQAGRPTVVSATGTYLDVSSEMVVHVPAGRPPVRELSAAIGGLCEDAELRRKMGEAARAHARKLSLSDATTMGYLEAVEGTLALMRDPAHLAMERWASALTDLGVTGEGLDLGYGLSYVEALQSFTGTS